MGFTVAIFRLASSLIASRRFDSHFTNTIESHSLCFEAQTTTSIASSIIQHHRRRCGLTRSANHNTRCYFAVLFTFSAHSNTFSLTLLNIFVSRFSSPPRFHIANSLKSAPVHDCCIGHRLHLVVRYKSKSNSLKVDSNWWGRAAKLFFLCC